MTTCANCGGMVGVGARAVRNPTWRIAPGGIRAGSYIDLWANSIATYVMEEMPQIHDAADAARLRANVVQQVASAIAATWPGGPAQAIADVAKRMNAVNVPMNEKRFMLIVNDGRYGRAALEALRNGPARAILISSPLKRIGVAGRSRVGVGCGGGCGGSSVSFDRGRAATLAQMLTQRMLTPGAGVAGGTGVGCGCATVGCGIGAQQMRMTRLRTPYETWNPMLLKSWALAAAWSQYSSGQGAPGGSYMDNVVNQLRKAISARWKNPIEALNELGIPVPPSSQGGSDYGAWVMMPVSDKASAKKLYNFFMSKAMAGVAGPREGTGVGCGCGGDDLGFAEDQIKAAEAARRG